MSAANGVAAIEKSGIPHTLIDAWSRASENDRFYSWMWVAGWLRKCERFGFRGEVAEEMLWLADIAELLHAAELSEACGGPPCADCVSSTCSKGAACAPRFPWMQA